MSAENSISLIGRVGREPELSYTSSGTAVTKFSLAVDRGSGEDKKTDWFFINSYGKQAELLSERLTKGSLVAVLGRMESWRKGEDGPTMWTVVLDPFGLKFLEKRRDGNEEK